MRKMNAAQRRRRAVVENMIILCGQRGLGPEHLRPRVYDMCTRKVGTRPAPHRVKPEQANMAHEISGAGLMAQLSYLREVWGEKKLHAELMKMGGVLDAIVLHTSSSPVELEEDLGRDNVDVNGDVM